MRRRHDNLKRCADVVLAAMLLAILSPLLAATALIVWLRLGRPVFFFQERAGLLGHPITIAKFRTMSDEVGVDGDPLPDDARLTGVMRLMRRTGLDELPQLWSVLRGEMSLVGPRPLFIRYLDRYSAVQVRRLEVRPGITGWAQVNGRTALGWERQFELDVWYVDNRSLLLDARILWRSLLLLFVRRSGPEASRPEFQVDTASRKTIQDGDKIQRSQPVDHPRNPYSGLK